MRGEGKTEGRKTNKNALAPFALTKVKQRSALHPPKALKPQKPGATTLLRAIYPIKDSGFFVEVGSCGDVR